VALREHNEAHQLIVENEEALGKKNIETLQSQVDTITWTSYIVYVDLVDAKNELDDRIAESGDVKKTLDSNIESHQAALDGGELSKDKEKLYEDQLESMKTARDALDQSTQAAKKTRDDIDKKQKELQKAYETALDDLLADIEDRANAQAEEAKKAE